MNTGNQFGAFLTAMLTPWIAAHFGWTSSFLVAASLCVVGAASWLVVDPTRTLSAASPETPSPAPTGGPALAARPNPGPGR
jgi:ACS family glucarate transporter-like MFS transporter